MAKQDIYEFHVELADFTPLIWRTVQMTEKQTLAQLGYLLMSTFEVKANHQFELRRTYQLDPVPGLSPFEDTRLYMKRYVIPSQYDGQIPGIQTFDATKMTLKDAFAAENDIKFVYDFGDEWTISVRLLRVFNDPEVPAYQLPRIIDGNGYGIIEDAGGARGMRHQLDVLKNPSNPEYAEVVEWLDTANPDITYFELDSANKRLRTLMPAFARLYEQGQDLSAGAMRMLRRGLPEE